MLYHLYAHSFIARVMMQFNNLVIINIFRYSEATFAPGKDV